VIAGHHKPKALGAILENQPDVQPHPDFKKFPVSLRMPKPDDGADARNPAPNVATPARFSRASPWDNPGRVREMARLNPAVFIGQILFQIAGKAFDLPRFRSAEICCSIRFSKRASSAGVAPYSRQA